MPVTYITLLIVIEIHLFYYQKVIPKGFITKKKLVWLVKMHVCAHAHMCVYVCAHVCVLPGEDAEEESPLLPGDTRGPPEFR